MKLKEIGFFRELRHSERTGPSLVEAQHQLQLQQADVDEIVRYLEEAPTLATTGSLVDDVLNDQVKAVAREEIATDGTWVWRRDLAYYVRQYRVGLPSDFVAAVRLRHGELPALTEAELQRLAHDEYVEATRGQ